jgi:hypothetical protein
VLSSLCSLPAAMFARVCAGVPPTGFHRSTAGFRGCAGRGAWVRAGGLSWPDHRSRLVGNLHASGTRDAAAGAAHRVVAHPDRVSPTYLTFAPVLACIDRASHLSHTVTSRFHRSVIVCSNGGLFYRAQSGISPCEGQGLTHAESSKCCVGVRTAPAGYPAATGMCDGGM